MKLLHRKDYEQMIAGAKVISFDHYGDKVLELPDGLMLKLFRLKRRLSSALIWPYAKRFERGARQLRQLHIPTVEVVASYRIESVGRHAVVYRPLGGKTLRDALKDSKKSKDLLERFSAFLARLHNQGIYFRAIHFGNVIVLQSGDFGLIDVSEIRTSRWSLGIGKRIRNFKPIFRYKEDLHAIQAFGLDLFLDIYLRSSNLPPNARRSFLRRIKCTNPPTI